MARLGFRDSTMHAGKTTTLLQSACNSCECSLRLLQVSPAINRRAGHEQRKHQSLVPHRRLALS
jgi:thymidine kinase